MKIKIAITDDLDQDREALAGCIRRFFSERPQDSVSIEMYKNAEEMASGFTAGSFDLVFLDICMDEMNGIELARRLRAADARLMIVFQTTAREYAFDAFPVHPFDYLIKPCRQDEVDAVLGEAGRVLDSGDPEISVTAVRANYSVPLRSIIAAVSSGHNTELFLTNEQKLICSESFKSISGKISGDSRFLLINRGVMINMDHVQSPEADCMRMRDGSRFPIRVNGRAAVLTAFSQYMISRVDKRG